MAQNCTCTYHTSQGGGKERAPVIGCPVHALADRQATRWDNPVGMYYGEGGNQQRHDYSHEDFEI